MTEQLIEHNIDGLIGPTHFFGGLGMGNLASQSHAGQVSRPKAAALQGLKKMKYVHDLGIPQLIMPPHPRPALGHLRQLGYEGGARAMLQAVTDRQPELLTTIYSASAMWTANAATIAPSTDTPDGKLHTTTANLLSNAHRRIEPDFTAYLLPKLLPCGAFMHHQPLANTPHLRDEGAANHMRLTLPDDGTGLHIFIYGDASDDADFTLARQHQQASQQIAQQHGIAAQHVIFLQQSPAAIEAGVFHNDVIATSHRHAVFYHEAAYIDDAPLRALAAKHTSLQLFTVTQAMLTLDEAVRSYVFNSQIVDDENGGMHMLAPRQCEHSAQASAVIAGWLADKNCPIARVSYIDVEQSMANGGGPACLRLRLPLTEGQANMVPEGFHFTPMRYAQLCGLIQDEYPDSISPEDLMNPDFAQPMLDIYPKIAALLDMPDLYDGWL